MNKYVNNVYISEQIGPNWIIFKHRSKGQFWGDIRMSDAVGRTAINITSNNSSIWEGFTTCVRHPC